MRFGSTLKAEAIKEGDDVFFECEIDAKPRAHRVEWRFNVRKRLREMKYEGDKEEEEKRQ